MDMDFERDRKVDPSQLDVEAVQQADLFYKWAEQSVEARAKVDRLKFDLEVLEAKLALQCRSDPASFGLSTEKAPTEGAIKAAVLTNQTFIQGTLALQEATRKSSLLSMAVAAMEQKKRMIEVLITLHGQEYFAGPSVPRDLVSAWSEHQSKVTGNVNERQASVARKRVRSAE